MTVSYLIGQLLMAGLIDSSTRVYVRDFDLHVLFQGEHDSFELENFASSRLESFTWEDGTSLYINLVFGEDGGFFEGF